MTIPVVRRIGCALIAIAIAAVLVRGSLADALVARGDDALRNGDLRSAIQAYRRALWFDGTSLVAADRLAFFLSIRHDPDDARDAIAVLTRALRRSPRDITLLADRGLAELQLRRWRAARDDFARAASGGDPRYAMFARLLAARR